MREVIKIPAIFRTIEVIFDEEGVSYKNQKILYRDIRSLGYQLGDTSLYGLPFSSIFEFGVSSEDKAINIKFDLRIFVMRKGAVEAGGQLLNLIREILEPALTENLLREVFVNKKIVTIGEVEFSSSGYCKTQKSKPSVCFSWEHEPVIEVASLPKPFEYSKVKVLSVGGQALATFPTTTANGSILEMFIAGCLKSLQKSGV